MDDDFPRETVLSRPLMAHLASASPDGPRESPVWFLWEDPVLWLVGRAQDSFVQRLSRDPRCAIGVVDFDVEAGRLLHVGIRGRAEVRPLDPAILERLLKRYLGDDRSPWRKDFVTRVVDHLDVVVRVTPKSIVCRDQSYFKPALPPRDFSTISPSAKSLLMVKAQTSLPFARQAAEFLWGASAVQEAERETASTPWAAGRRAHFEHRSRSIDAAIEAVGSPLILELAAGLSFRGLDMTARRADVFYLDTDLPEIAATKANLVARLHPSPLLGTLLVRPLDALDVAAVRAAVDLVPAGPIAIVQEGLLMYLDDAEKTALAANVREVLLARGGAWITADVYVRSALQPHRDERTTKFLEQHRVEEKKFADFAAATAFFESHGFAVTRRQTPEKDPWPVRQTWVLEAVR
jgi:O-methyltransferase involved in polyketide biosynthesis